jgi:hypothetical protein
LDVVNWDGAFNDQERPKGLLCDRGGFRVSSSADKLCAAAYSLGDSSSPDTLFVSYSPDDFRDSLGARSLRAAGCPPGRSSFGTMRVCVVRRIMRWRAGRVTIKGS